MLVVETGQSNDLSSTYVVWSPAGAVLDYPDGVFGRNQTPDTPPADEASAAGKGRATPSRKAAEAARRQPLVPLDRKAAKKQAQAAAAKARDEAYQAMMSGDVARMPAEHRPPVRTYIRNYVDSRRSTAQYFLPVVFGFLLAAMVASGFLASLPQPWPQVSLWMMALPYIYLAGAVLEAYLMWKRLRVVLVGKFGLADARARGNARYFVARLFQLRQLRMPKPQVRYGEDI